MAKNRLERSPYDESKADFHFLDLHKFRPISNAIAEKWNVRHESPQVLIISKGECIYNESHSGIVMDEIMDQV